MTILQHLHSRYLDTNKHRVWIAEELQCAVFPLWNLSGQLVGYQRYQPFRSKEKSNDPREGRYFTRIKEGRVGVWGLESWSFSNTVFITEGIFDACRLTYLGLSAVALLSFDVGDSTKSWLSCVRACRPVVAVCDADSSGVRLARYAHVAHHMEKGDLGDASDQYVKKLVNEYG